MTKTKTQTVTETTTLLWLKISSRETQQDWCAECATEASWIDLAAVEFWGDCRLTADGGLHIRGNRVCLPSLVAQIKK